MIQKGRITENRRKHHSQLRGSQFWRRLETLTVVWIYNYKFEPSRFLVANNLLRTALPKPVLTDSCIPHAERRSEVHR